ncbi:MAG: hypothetical protein MIO93_10555 [ANME-2 cluster archaeon]|jgi:hypothetical protein|nr:hypothetical protein [ANME-2 cluster archaeon]
MSNRLIFSQNAVSEVVGYMLLLGIIVTSVGLVSVLAIPIIEDAKEDAYLKNMEQGFTVLDSKVSLVTLGKSPTQLVQMNCPKGDITVYDQNTSHITVTYTDFNETYEIYNESLGTIQYQLGENKIAFEGGGVFRKYPGEGDPVTITPPEFHYNGETLTLPIIKVEGNQSVGGSGVVNIYLVSNNTPNVLFPNPDFDSNYTNPLTLGKTMSVVIKSDYYMGWANYIKERTEAEVSTNSVNKEVRVKLNAKPNSDSQDFEVPIDVFGFNVSNESGLQNFSVILDNGSGDMKMRLTTSETSTEPYFTLYAQRSEGHQSLGVTIELFYYDNNDKEGWKWDSLAMWDEDRDEFHIDFLNDTGNITYESGESDSWTWVNASNCGGTYVNQQKNFSCGGQELVQHYMSLVGPTFTFYPDDDDQFFTGFDPYNSSYILYYDVMPPRITFMHVVEHKIEVKVG